METQILAPTEEAVALAARILREGDRIEIVHAIGGG